MKQIIILIVAFVAAFVVNQHYESEINAQRFRNDMAERSHDISVSLNEMDKKYGDKVEAVRGDYTNDIAESSRAMKNGKENLDDLKTKKTLYPILIVLGAVALLFYLRIGKAKESKS